MCAICESKRMHSCIETSPSPPVSHISNADAKSDSSLPRNSSCRVRVSSISRTHGSSSASASRYESGGSAPSLSRTKSAASNGVWSVSKLSSWRRVFFSSAAESPPVLKRFRSSANFKPTGLIFTPSLPKYRWIVGSLCSSSSSCCATSAARAPVPDQSYDMNARSNSSSSCLCPRVRASLMSTSTWVTAAHVAS